jgi:hypothetical protein
MATSYPEIFASLAAPFGREEIRTRTAPGGRTLHYATARTVMNRLDSVLGPESWWDRYELIGQAGMVCHLSVKLPDGQVVTKQGIGGITVMPDESDSEKTGESDAFKRAAAKFGVGRYLYGDGVPRFEAEPATENMHGSIQAPAPIPAPPADDVARKPRPRSGKALYGWIRDFEAIRTNPRILNHVSRWGHANGMPGRMLDWDADQVVAGWSEIKRHLADLGHVITNPANGTLPSPTAR